MNKIIVLFLAIKNNKGNYIYISNYNSDKVGRNKKRT